MGPQVKIKAAGGIADLKDAEDFIALGASRPVSYTHLDVYKRQVPWSSLTRHQNDKHVFSIRKQKCEVYEKLLNSCISNCSILEYSVILLSLIHI